jgi:hypothetical protein
MASRTFFHLFSEMQQPYTSIEAVLLIPRWTPRCRGTLVSASHYHMQYFTFMQNCYRPTPDDTYVLQLPIIRVFYSGWFMVSIFFMLSG